MSATYRDRIEQPHHTLIVVGDTQRSMGVARLLGRRDDNDAERRAILRDIAQQDAGCVVLAGDLVSLGESSADWAYFDDVMTGIRSRDVPTLPVMGNHDYFVFRRRADVRGVLVFGHHPPYTNSWVVGPHAPTQRDILPIFHRSRKSLAYISGHCHAYERFEERGKTLLVSGGGGGPRQALRRGFFARSIDRYPGGVFRPFHYLSMRIAERGLEVEVRGLDRGEHSLRMLERFARDWPASSDLRQPTDAGSTITGIDTSEADH